MPDLRSGTFGFTKNTEEFTKTTDLTVDQGLSENIVDSSATEYLSVLSDLLALHLPSGLQIWRVERWMDGCETHSTLQSIQSRRI